MSNARRREAAAAYFATYNPVLDLAEEGYETDTHLFKAGDGVTPYMSLPYSTPDPRNARPNNRLAVMGDSQTNNSGSLDPTTGNANNQLYGSKGYAFLANSLCGWRYKIITPGVTGAGSVNRGAAGIGFALGGIYTEDLINGGYLSAAVASDASVVVVLIGTNNLNRGDTSTQIMADLVTIWRALTNAGKTVVACTILPRDSTVITGSKLTNHLAVNVAIRQTAAAMPNVVVCDWYTALLDPTTAAAPSGSGASAYFADGLHPNPAGAWRMASVLAPVLAQLVGPEPADDWLPNHVNDSMTPNPFATGNVSGVATSWTVTTVGSPSVGPTKTMVARSDLVPGQWQQIAVTATTPTADGWSITVTDSTTSDWVAGQTVVFASCELQADAAGWDCRGLQLDVVLTGVSQIASADNIASADRTALTVPLGPAPVAGSINGMNTSQNMVLITPRIVVPASVTAVRAVLRFWGSGTLRCSRFGVHKVA